MELAPKAHRTDSQLVATRGKYVGQHGLRVTLRQVHDFLPKSGAAIRISKQDNFGELGHALEEGWLNRHYSASSNAHVAGNILSCETDNRSKLIAPNGAPADVQQ